MVSRLRTSVRTERRFVEPPWLAPLDADAVIRAIPDSAMVRGFLTMPMVAEAKARRFEWQPPRTRYLPFNLYPLREHAQTLVHHSQAMYPALSLRQGLRKLGRGAPNALLGSTMGKVTLGSAEGVCEVVSAFAKAYALSMEPGSASVVKEGKQHVIVALESVPYFLDCHHVGAFESVLHHAGVKGAVTIVVTGVASAEFLLAW